MFQYFYVHWGLGVAGGAASGKTTVCDMIIQQLHDQRVVLVNQVNICILMQSNLLNGNSMYRNLKPKN